MCTVTFAVANKSIIITSNRDENIDRAATTIPTIQLYNTHQIIHPTDNKAKGTWIGVNNNNTVAVLLNGALYKHTKATYYAMSRGLIIPTILQTNNAEKAITKLYLNNIEPFTLLLLEANYLYLYRWNGEALSKELLAINEYHIISSATLYNEQYSQQKREAFNNFKNKNNLTNDTILAFHKSQYYENWLPIEAAKNHIKTISTSQIIIQHNISTFNYFDFISNQHTVSKFTSKAVAVC